MQEPGRKLLYIASVFCSSLEVANRLLLSRGVEAEGNKIRPPMFSSVYIGLFDHSPYSADSIFSISGTGIY
jgi:hypothetical protein